MINCEFVPPGDNQHPTTTCVNGHPTVYTPPKPPAPPIYNASKHYVTPAVYWSPAPILVSTVKTPVKPALAAASLLPNLTPSQQLKAGPQKTLTRPPVFTPQWT